MSREELLRSAAYAYALLANEPVPEEVDVVYIHGLTEGMVEGQRILEQAAELAFRHQCPIAFNGSNGGSFAQPDVAGAAWPGADYYVERLIALGVNHDNMFPTGPGLHTRQEADQFATIAKERGWRRVLIVSVGYHSVRCLCTHVAAMNVVGHPYAAYFAQPKAVDWDYPMSSSQGQKTTTARQELSDEIDRILVGWEKGAGDAWRQGYNAPPDMVFDYLRDRHTLV